MVDARAGGERCGLLGFAVTLPPAAIPGINATPTRDAESAAPITQDPGSADKTTAIAGLGDRLSSLANGVKRRNHWLVMAPVSHQEWSHANCGRKFEWAAALRRLEHATAADALLCGTAQGMRT